MVICVPGPLASDTVDGRERLARRGITVDRPVFAESSESRHWPGGVQANTKILQGGFEFGQGDYSR